MKSRFASRLMLGSVVVATLCFSSYAADDIKANNTTTLTSTGSWTDGSVPTIANNDIITWNSTVTGANTVAIGGNLGVLGIKVLNPGGAVAITNATGNVLTIGSSGIDMSAATQNLSIFSAGTAAAGNIDISANQTWNVASARTLTLFNNSGSLNSRLTGSGNIEIIGGGIVRVLTGDAGNTSFTAGNGNDTYSGNWTVTSGSLRGLRNGTHAWGTGTIFMNGGTIGQEQGNWTWTNNIVLNTSTSSTIDDFNTGSTRTLKLQGVISGSGNLTFAETGGGSHSADGGYILTGANTLSGTVTINAAAVVRIGGVGGEDTTTGVGSTGTLGTATIVNNGTLTLSRNNTWTFANNMSGSGLLRVGVTTGEANHIVTVSGNNTHSGGTTLQSAVTLRIGSSNALGNGTFTIAGNGIFDNATGSALSVGNAFTLSNGSPTFTGTHDMTINGAVTLGGANRTITTTAGNLTLGGNISGAFNLTKAGAGTLTLNGTGSHNATIINAGTLVLGNAINTLPDAQAVTVNGGILSIGSNNDTVGAVTLTSGSIAGSTGTLTGSSYAVSDGTISAILGGTGALTKSTTGTVTLSGANTYSGTTVVNAGMLVFANKAARSASTSVSTLSTGTVGFGVHDTDAAYYSSSELASVYGATLAGFTLDSASAVAVDTNNAGGSFNQNVALTGSRSLIKLGTGILSLTAANTYTGSTTVQSGALQLSGGTDRLAASGSVILGAGTNSGTLVLDGISQTLASLTTSGTGTANAVVGGNATASTLTLSFASATVTYGGRIGGAGTNDNNIALSKSGDGTLVLSGVNTYTVGTTLNAGTLQVGNASALGTGGLTINGGTLTSGSSELAIANNISLNGSAIFNGTAGIQGMRLNGVISGAGILTKEGTGRFTVVNDSDVNPNTFSGSTTINAGIMAISLKALANSSSVHVAGTTDGGLAIGRNGITLINNLTGTANGRIRSDFSIDGVNGSRILQVNQTVNGDFAGSFIQGSSRAISLIKSGSATLTLSGGGGYTGGTVLSQGSIIATNANALGTSGTVTINDTNTGSNNTSLLLGSVTMGRSINVANEGSGTVVLGANGAVALAEFSGVITLNRSVTLDGGINSDRLTFSGGIGGTGNVSIAGSGRVVFNGAANTYNGNTIINAGSTLQLGVGGGISTQFIPNASVVNTGAGSFLKLAKGSNNETIGGLTGSGTVRGHEAVSSAASVLTIDSSANHDFSGVLENGGAAGSTLSLVKQGNGIQILSGTSTYTGATIVSAGTLYVNGAIGNTAVTVQNGATIGGTGTIAGSLNFAATSLLEVVDWNNPLAVSGTITFGSGFGINQLSGIDWDALALGTHTLISTSQVFSSVDLNHFGFDNRLSVGTQGREAYFTNGSLAVVVIPEPSIPLISGLSALLILRRRRTA